MSVHKNKETKGKLYQIMDPFDDPVKETKRLNAINAFTNRKKTNLKKFDLEQQYNETQSDIVLLQREKDRLQNRIKNIEIIKTTTEQLVKGKTEINLEEMVDEITKTVIEKVINNIE